MRLPVAVGVMLTVQVAVAPVPARVQVPPRVTVTVPVGVVVISSVSLTVTVQLVAWPTRRVVGAHEMVVVVACTATLIVKLAELLSCAMSPG